MPSRVSTSTSTGIWPEKYAGVAALTVATIVYFVLAAVEAYFYPDIQNFNWFGNFAPPLDFVLFVVVIVAPLVLLGSMLLVELTHPHPRLVPFGIALMVALTIVIWFLGYEIFILVGAFYFIGTAIVLSISRKS